MKLWWICYNGDYYLEKSEERPEYAVSSGYFTKIAAERGLRRKLEKG